MSPCGFRGCGTKRGMSADRGPDHVTRARRGGGRLRGLSCQRELGRAVISKILQIADQQRLRQADEKAAIGLTVGSRADQAIRLRCGLLKKTRCVFVAMPERGVGCGQDEGIARIACTFASSSAPVVQSMIQPPTSARRFVSATLAIRRERSCAVARSDLRSAS